MESNNFFHVIDYCVLIGMMVLSVAIGIYYAFSGGRQKSTQEYFIGNRSMGLLPISLSLLASFFSANTLIGVPSEVYAFGFNWWFSLTGALLAMPFVAYCIMPIFYNLGSTNVYEYLEQRFDRRVRLTCSVIYILYTVLYLAFMTYGPSLALTQVSGINFWISVVTISVIGTVYTVIGGIKAVMWTDSLQLLIVIGSVLVIAVKGLIDIGGFPELIRRNVEGLRIEPLSFSFDPRVRFSFWGVSMFSLLLLGGTYGMSQFQVQRYLSAPSIQVARRALWLNVPGQFLIQSLVCLIGLLMYAQYWKCDPLVTKRIAALDQILPLYVMDILGEYPGIPGLFVAGMISGSLSTTSSVLNSLGVIILNDYIKPQKRWSKLPDEQEAKIAKWIATFFGLFTILVVGLVSIVGSDIQQASGTVLGCLQGSAYGVFYAGIFCPWIPSLGAFVGLLCGFAFSTWVGLGISLTKANSIQKLPVSNECLIFNTTMDLISSNVTSSAIPITSELNEIPQLYRISYVWNYVYTIFLIAIVGSTFSLFIRNSTYERRLYSPLINYIHDKLFKNSEINKTKIATYSTCPTKEEIMETDQ